MPENEKYPGEEKLIILPLGEESKKITQVISNDTARQIIELLADSPLSASDIAGRLKAPLTTVIYNLENLESVGLVKVERIKYSEKGREVKIYAPVRKLIVVVPGKTDRKSVADILRKYLGVILAAVLASGMIEFFTRSAGRSAKVIQISGDSPPLSSPVITELPAIKSVEMVNETAKSGDLVSIASTPSINYANTTAAYTPAAPPELYNGAASQPDIFTNLANTITAHPGLLFLLGCLFIVAMLIVMDYHRKRKNG